MKYLVKKMHNEKQAADILATMNNKIQKITNYLCHHIDEYPEFYHFINQFCERIKKLKLKENIINDNYTSYTVDKTEIILCLRSKTTGHFHDINLLTYVLLHELAHIACPTKGHDKSFRKIFIFLIDIAIKIDIYKQKNYQNEPVEYCGIHITENLL